MKYVCSVCGFEYDEEGYCFTSDAILLANTVKCKRGDTIVDFGCGNGHTSAKVSAFFDILGYINVKVLGIRLFCEQYVITSAIRDVL